jgi:hypothetical protein
LRLFRRHEYRHPRRHEDSAGLASANVTGPWAPSSAAASRSRAPITSPALTRREACARISSTRRCSVGLLKNPHQDVALVGAALKQLGFQVTILKDSYYRAMDVAIKRFVTDVRSKGKGTISFFYYSGHGAANPDTQINYLIPVDVADPNDGNLWYQSFQQNDLIDKLAKQAPNATHYVVFDACRNELNLSGSAAKAISAEKGFVPVPQTPGLLRCRVSQALPQVLLRAHVERNGAGGGGIAGPSRQGGD